MECFVLLIVQSCNYCPGSVTKFQAGDSPGQDHPHHNPLLIGITGANFSPDAICHNVYCLPALPDIDYMYQLG